MLDDPDEPPDVRRGRAKITNSLGDYPEAVRQAGEEEKVAVIDLNAMSKPFYEALGPVDAHEGFRRWRHHASQQLRQLRTGEMHRPAIREANLPMAKYLLDVPALTPRIRIRSRHSIFRPSRGL